MEKTFLFVSSRCFSVGIFLRCSVESGWLVRLSEKHLPTWPLLLAHNFLGVIGNRELIFDCPQYIRHNDSQKLVQPRKLKPRRVRKGHVEGHESLFLSQAWGCCKAFIFPGIKYLWWWGRQCLAGVDAAVHFPEQPTHCPDAHSPSYCVLCADGSRPSPSFFLSSALKKDLCRGYAPSLWAAYI